MVGALSRGTIAYGVLLSAAVAAGFVALLLAERRTSAAAAAIGPLRMERHLATHGLERFFVDAPIGVLPASWQDTGSGVFALATASLLLGLGPLRAATALRALLTSAVCAAAAFLVDVYLY